MFAINAENLKLSYKKTKKQLRYHIFLKKH